MIPEVVKVARSRWYRGEGAKESALRRSDKRMCCLGFVAKAAGCSNADISGVKSPEGLAQEARKKVRQLFLSDNWSLRLETSRMMDLNDGPLMSGGERERKLNEGAAQMGFQLEFVD